MEVLKIYRRNKDNVKVSIMQDEETCKYRFVNLTKHHICKCQFDTIADAMSDLKKYVERGEIYRIIRSNEEDNVQ